MLFHKPKRNRYLDDGTFQNAMRIWEEEEPLRVANATKSMDDKIKEALTHRMLKALSSRQIDIIERNIDKMVAEDGERVTPSMILGVYELTVTLVWPEAATDKYTSPSLHFP